jgi:hypothetical protein
MTAEHLEYLLGFPRCITGVPVRISIKIPTRLVRIRKNRMTRSVHFTTARARPEDVQARDETAMSNGATKDEELRLARLAASKPKK